MPDDIAISPAGAMAFGPGTVNDRPPPKWIRVLLPVWGYDFVHRFITVSLPTLLAPGNLPALAATLPTQFVFLTSRIDKALIRQTPGYRKLSEICEVQFCLIDDLITDTNYSTTITLAYARAVRESGTSMLDTCFFFLVSDYIIADGSFRSVIARMRSGASAVQTGNFQVVEEDILSRLAEARGQDGDVLVLSPRKLMQLALTCVHPGTIANTVNLPISHNSHSNRLFWRVDANTLIGRFYLMHMLCIRPQITDFVVGSSCDYSFIPEMCPSGGIGIVTDSDECLFVEAQPRHHEARFLRLGTFKPRRLAASLSEWTTIPQRANAKRTLFFHARDIPDAARLRVAEADAFIEKVSRLLKRKPAPFRGHPYWRAAIAVHQADTTGKRPEEEAWDLVLGRKDGFRSRFRRKLRRLVIGRLPRVRHWHPRRVDYQRPVRELKKLLGNREARLLVVSQSPTPLTNWLADYSGQTVRTPTSRLLRPDFVKPDGGVVRFDACLLELGDNEIEHARRIVDRIVPFLKLNGTILVVSFNDRWFVGADTFGKTLVLHLNQFFGRLDVSLDDMEFLTTTRSRWNVNADLVSNCEGFFELAPLAALFRGLAITYLAPVALARNALAWRRIYRTAVEGKIISSWFMRLQVTPGSAQGGNSHGLAGGLSPVGNMSARDFNPDAVSLTREPQYSRLLEIKNEIGLTTLGLMTNQVWEEDPRRLGILLARYKFVAKTLSGWKSVAEVGCGDAFGTRVVLQEVEQVDVYDFDPVFIDDISRRFSTRWPIRPTLHDILSGPLPRRHDAIYSLDVIEHIPHEKEALYLRHLVASLSENGVLIIGTPSLESQAYASPQSKAGHINCKSGDEIKELLKKYFKNVFLFSMNDEVVHTGFYPLAHYLFVVCSMKV
jgi:2-polyprenyl-3-methyl-5-hydroxy-6-metoxy-1,4-benzoquinol methylase